MQTLEQVTAERDGYLEICQLLCEWIGALPEPMIWQMADLLNLGARQLLDKIRAGELPDPPTWYDLLHFREVRRSRRRQALRQLTQEAEELGLYDLPFDDLFRRETEADTADNGSIGESRPES